MPNRHRTTEELAFNTTVGNNIKYVRKLRNFTQSRVGKAIGTTFQQVQKYEKGADGVSAIKLKAMADLFGLKTDVLIDPNFIPYHKGFTGQDDWLDKKLTPQDAGYLKPQEDIGSLEEIMETVKCP